ncbi:hypothetical protein [Saccharopolyspora antimicrobica]|uniref:hypothetical protein n=1 Tax=Saccharopolyspora antimicrobica TaxID=455193 RepID=UPI000B8A427A|nr:hypothetical protein [Saccharopolyspora antimicrobica]
MDVVVRHGSLADAEALLPVFLAAPEERAELVRVLARHGDTALAERLLAECVDAGRLRPGVPAEVLRALGILESENAEELLWTYAANPDDHDTGLHAALGLLHLPCTGVREEIARALEKHEGRAFFPEFLPALATKTQDPSWLQRLVAWASRAPRRTATAGSSSASRCTGRSPAPSSGVCCGIRAGRPKAAEPAPTSGPTPHRDDSLTGWAADLLGHDDPLLAKLYQLEAELNLRMHHELEREKTAARPGGR